MPDEIKVSVIVPVYNVAKYLSKCLRSLSEQKLKEIEIICVNDGSTDNSGEIIEKFALKDPRIKIINTENHGLSAARNCGIRAAQGKYLGFVDSDDYADRDYFKKLYEAAEKYNCPLACAGYKRFKFTDGKILQKFEKYEVFDEINEKVKTANIPNDNYVWNKIYNRKDFLDNGLSFPEGHDFEDMIASIKFLYNMGKMITVPDTYYHYRNRAGSIVKLKHHTESFYHAKNELYSFAKEHDIKLCTRKDYYKKEYFKLFGLTVFKIYYYENLCEYYLLGIIPLKKITKTFS